MNFKEQNGGKMSQVNWNGFINKFGDNCHTKFEEMTRKIFRIGVLKDATRNLIGLSNSPGIEVEPVEFEGQKISFQSKFFTERPDYEDIEDSFKKIITYYKGKIDKVYLYCNRKLNINKSETYKRAVQNLIDNNIQLEPVCDENILDVISDMPEFKSLKEIYFGLKDYSGIVKEKTSSFKRFLKRNLIRDKYVDREEDQEILQNLDKKFLTIYGDANTGKSSIIYNLCDYFDKNAIPYFPLRLDCDIPNKNMTTFSKSLDMGESFIDTFFSLSNGDKAFIILDQFDAIRWNSVHSGTSLTLCDQIIEEVMQYPNLSIIFSTRTIDLSELRNLIGKYNNGNYCTEIEITKIHENTLKNVLSPTKYNKLDQKTKDLLLTIGNIRLYEEINEDETFSSSIELIRKFLAVKYQELESLGLSREANKIESYIVQKQKVRNQLFINRQELTNFNKLALTKLIDIGILENVANNKIKYTHQCLYDFRLVSDIFIQYKDGKDVNCLIKSFNFDAINHIDLIKQFLDLIKEDSPNKLCSVVEKILFDKKIRFLFKKLAISVLSSFTLFPEEQVKLFEKIIKSKLFGKSYVYQLSINKPFIVEYLIKKESYPNKLSDFDFYQYSSILISVITLENIFQDEYIKLIDDSSLDSNRLSHLCYNIDDFSSSDKLFNKKIEILEKHPDLIKYYSIKHLDKKRQDRLYQYILTLIKVDRDDFIDYLPVKDVASTLEQYAEDINQQIFKYFITLDKSTKGFELYYMYDIDKNHIHSKIDCLKEYFKYTLQFLCKEQILKFIYCEINFVVDSALKSVLNLAEKEALFVLKSLIRDNFLTKQNFHSTRNRIYILADIFKYVAEKLSAKLFKDLESQIINYREPDFIEFAKERLSYRKKGGFYSYFGEEQKILLEALDPELLESRSLDFLKMLKRKFVTAEFFPVDFKEGVGPCRSVVSCIHNKKFTKPQWIQILTNKKTGHRDLFSNKIDENGNYVSSDLSSIKLSVFSEASANVDMFIDILQGNNIRYEFIPSILEGIVSVGSLSENQLDEVVKLFKKHLTIDNDEIVSPFVNFVKKYKFFNEWIVSTLVSISKCVYPKRILYKDDEKKNYYKLFQEALNNSQTSAINCLVDYLIDQKEKPCWFDELIRICRESSDEMLKLSELELGFACINFDTSLCYEICLNILNNYPNLIQHRYAIRLIDYKIKDKQCSNFFETFIKRNYRTLEKKAKDTVVCRLIYYYVYYGFAKNFIFKLLKNKLLSANDISHVITDLVEKQRITDSDSQYLDKNQTKRLVKTIKRLINYKKGVGRKLLINIEDNIVFFDNHNLLYKFLTQKNSDSLFIHTLIEVFKQLTPIVKYSKIIFETCLYQIRNNRESQLYINDILACLYKLYGEYNVNEKNKKEKCINVIEQIYKYSCDTKLYKI